jgi:hypothetical protein
MNKARYRIHPSIGIGRLGNSESSFYLAPEKIGGLPIEADANGNPIKANGQPKYVHEFKDEAGKIKRQAASFKVYRSEEDGTEKAIDINDEGIQRIEWTVHVANKKAVWWNYVPLLGDLMFGPDNSYETWANPPAAWKLPTDPWTGVPWMQRRNNDVKGVSNRQKLIIDPGPRTLDKKEQSASFDENTDYPFKSFPDASEVSQGLSIKTLGEMRTDSNGNLLVLGGFGRAGGDETIEGFGGGDTWNDDISDGPVTATIHFKNGESVELKAWVVMGSPKFAPELINISTWDDVANDAAIKYMGASPTVFNTEKWKTNKGWNPDYIVNYDHDVKPFLDRIADYQWVANVPSMSAFVRPAFDVKDASVENREQRKKLLSYFRAPSERQWASQEKQAQFVGGQNNQLFSDAVFNDDPIKNEPAKGIPLMPVNSGSNSVRNQILDKFSVLTDTQYYCLTQWSEGKFSSDAVGITIPDIHALDMASIGNCVGEPMSPGIEVTWSVRNPVIYEKPYVIKHRHDSIYYRKHGLSPNEDECQPINWSNPILGDGCEPGDLTKRMAIPWQADFTDCSVQMVNFTSPDSPVKDNATGIPIPPNYYSYWWPPQSPWNVIAGGTTAENQALDGNTSAGMQVMYSRGINSYAQMITGWKYLGFIVNQNEDEKFGRQYPYFTENERSYDKFQVMNVDITPNSLTENSVELPVWFLKDEKVDKVASKRLKLEAHLVDYHSEVPKPIKEAIGQIVKKRYGH